MMNVDRSLSRFVALLTFISVLSIAHMSALAGRTEFFPMEDLTPGLRGHAHTVVRGTEVESFDVEVLSVLPDVTSSGDLVLIRASGDVIDQTGGIASGMSGSPVYVDGKLVGAIGYGFQMADHTIGLVTPIHSMYKVLERMPVNISGTPHSDQYPIPLSMSSDNMLNNRLETITLSAETLTKIDPSAEDITVKPLSSPVMVSGLGKRAFERLKEQLVDFDVVPIQSGAGAAGIALSTNDLQPGSAIGVQIASGDVNITSIGTITHIEDDWFLAFGHPLYNFGDVDLIATGAYIHHTVNSLEFPFKLGSPLNTIGRISQDRSAAIAGTTASTADTVPIQIHVFDRDADARDTFLSDIIRHDGLTSTVAGVVALEAVDRTIDRLGGGTARVIMQITGENLSRRVVRDNMYYSHSDIAATSLVEFLSGLEAIMSNEFADVNLSNLRLDVEVEEKRWTARIVHAAPKQSEVRPGETVDIEVTLRPYRGELETKVITLDVPMNVHPGEVTVTARSGGLGYFRMPSDYVPTGVEDPSIDEEDQDEMSLLSIGNMDSLVDMFVNREKNNEVVVEYFPFYYGNEQFATGFSQNNGPYDDFRQSGFIQPIQNSLTTRYVIQGSAIFTLRIVEDRDEEDSEEHAASNEETEDDAVSEDSEENDEEADENGSDTNDNENELEDPNAEHELTTNAF